MVMGGVSQITSDGPLVLLIDDAPPRIHAPSLKLTRPELYYGEVTHEPVFVHTAEKEFNYPSGSDNVLSNYEGTGGFPISGFLMRLAAAVREGEPNILLTDYLTANSRMMIRRKVQDRLQELAGFLEWDPDPYLVITDAGRLVWMVDGYTTSDAHPYSRAVEMNGIGSVNYIRNAVKATVDAYDGETHLYVFAPDDPIIDSYQQLFPKLFLPESSMLRRSASARPLSRGAVPDPGGDLSHLSHACSTRSRSITRKTYGMWRGTTSRRRKVRRAPIRFTLWPLCPEKPNPSSC